MGKLTHGDVLPGGLRIWCITRIGPRIWFGVRDLATGALSGVAGTVDDLVDVQGHVPQAEIR